jgi:hypothetical protein
MSTAHVAAGVMQFDTGLSDGGAASLSLGATER